MQLEICNNMQHWLNIRNLAVMIGDMQHHAAMNLQHEQESCARDLHAKDQRKQLDTVRAKAGAAKDNEQRRLLI